MQAIVLLTGIIYIILGLLFYFSPMVILKAFAESVSENWLEQVQYSELMGPMYSILRAFAALVFISGIANVMPLFDPLKYRLLVYFNCIIFPAMSLIVFASHSIRLTMKSGDAVFAENTLESASHHTVILIMTAVFAGILLFNIAGILITRTEAKKGIE